MFIKNTFILKIILSARYPRANWVHECPSRLFPVGSGQIGHQYGFYEMRIQARHIPDTTEFAPGFTVLDYKNSKTYHQILTKQLELDNMQPEDLLKDGIYEDAVAFLKSTMDWKEPKFRAVSRSGTCFMAWYDRQSDASVNDVMDKLMNSQTPQYEKPRGAVLYFDYWKFAAPTTGQCTLNQLIFETCAKIQMPHANDRPELDDQMHKLIRAHADNLVRDRKCPAFRTNRNKIKKCEDCKNWLQMMDRGYLT